MSNPFNKNRARKSFSIKELYESPLFLDYYSQFKPAGIRREKEFEIALKKLCLEIVNIGFDEGAASKAEIGARRLGSRGGKIGGVVRARKLSPERRKEIAKRAANKRWNNL